MTTTNRRSFFRKLAGGIAAACAAPFLPKTVSRLPMPTRLTYPVAHGLKPSTTTMQDMMGYHDLLVREESQRAAELSDLQFFEGDQWDLGAVEK